MSKRIQETNVPLIAGARHWFELPNGDFVLINLEENANGEWVVEHHDHTNEFVAGLQINPNTGATSTKQVASSKPRRVRLPKTEALLNELL